jgi:cytochrome oxidase assembly protein ShyY1
MKRKRIKKLLQAVAVLSLAGIFFSLGLWQLGRAQEMSRADKVEVIQDQRVYQLSDLTQPNGDLPVPAVGKSVSLEGHYIANYKAPNQISSSGKVDDWEVALLQVDTGSAILVLRGLWSQRLKSPEIVMSTKVSVTGTIYPHQIEDRALNTASQLSRVDSSLITGATDLQLYDGFIAITSESYRGGAVDRERIAVALPKTGIPGYYWQHISYVVIWWLMAVMVLWAPFYRRKEPEIS